jgi:hypothetical protein
VIIWLASFPRSGNSFFRVVSRTVFGRDIQSIYVEKYAPVDADELQRMARDSELHLVKTHEMPSDSNPAIYLVRDGRDALVSLAWYSLSSRIDPDQEVPEELFQKELKKQILSTKFGGWSNNVITWTQRRDQSVIIRFDDLIVQPEQTVAEAFEAVGLGLQRDGKGNVPSFEDLHARNPALYRKGKVGDWQTQIPDDLHTLFWEEHGKAMQLLGYSQKKR